MSSTIIRRAQPWLGTLVSIEIVASHGIDVGAAFEHAFAAIARVQRVMSPQDAASDIGRFNDARAGELVDCDPWTIEVLRRAEALRCATGGLFDVALGSAPDGAYRHAAVACRSGPSDAATRPRVAGTWRIEKTNATARFDLGGIAKGYAVDRAVIALRGHRVSCGRVNAGGDLRVFGPEPWPVVVRGRDDARALQISIACGAVATSVFSAGRSPFQRDPLIATAHGGVHEIDRAITVAAPRCVLADALTKVVALTGDVRHPAVVQAGGRAWLH